MSGEQKVPRPIKSSHIRGEPFMKAEDFVEQEPVRWTLDKLAHVMIEGFNTTHVRIDELAVRVDVIQGEAVWKVRALKALKLAGPALVGAIAARFPEAAKLIAALLTGLPGVQ